MGYVEVRLFRTVRAFAGFGRREAKRELRLRLEETGAGEGDKRAEPRVTRGDAGLDVNIVLNRRMPYPEGDTHYYI